MEIPFLQAHKILKDNGLKVKDMPKVSTRVNYVKYKARIGNHWLVRFKFRESVHYYWESL